MPDETTTEETTTEPEVPADGGQPAELGDSGKRALEAERKEKREAQTALKKLQTELDTLRQSQMSETERAIAEAKAAGRAEAMTEAGSRIAASEFRAAASGRLGDKQLSTLLAGLDLKAFLDDQGDVDAAKVKSFVEEIAPAAAPEPEEDAGDLLAGLDFGQGARGTTTNVAGLGSTQLMRDLRKTLGM